MKEQPQPYRPSKEEFEKAKDMGHDMEMNIHREIHEITAEINNLVDVLESKIEALGSQGKNARGYDNALASQSRDYARRDCSDIRKRLEYINKVQ